MDNLKIPKIMEYIKTETLDKGRVQTTLYFFMIDSEVMNNIISGYHRGEIGVVESRIGVTIKHPKDKYDKKIAKAEAAKKLKKEKLEITHVAITKDKSTISLKSGIFLTHFKDSGKIIIKVY